MIMIKLIKKGGLRERANRSRSFKGSENTESTLQPHAYRQTKSITQLEHSEQNKSEQDNRFVPEPNCED
jgi:hypothetical protein